MLLLSLLHVYFCQLLGSTDELDHAHELFGDKEYSASYQASSQRILEHRAHLDRALMRIEKHREQKQLIAPNQRKEHSLVPIVQIEQGPSRFRFFVMLAFQEGDVHLVPVRD